MCTVDLDLYQPPSMISSSLYVPQYLVAYFIYIINIKLYIIIVFEAMNRQISLNHHLFATKDSRNIEHIDCFELYGFCGEKTHKKVPKIQQIYKNDYKNVFMVIVLMQTRIHVLSVLSHLPPNIYLPIF